MPSVTRDRELNAAWFADILPSTKRQPLRLHCFPLGIDNAQIDVALEASLLQSLRLWLSEIISEDLARSYWREKAVPASVEAEKAVEQNYTAGMHVALDNRLSNLRLERVQLYQLAFIKALLVLVDEELDHQYALLSEAHHDSRISEKGQALRLHERLVTYARARATLRYRAIQRVLRCLQRWETGPLRRLRKTQLGVSWPLDLAILTNPIIALGGLGGEDSFAQHYPLWLMQPAVLDALAKHLERAFEDWKPDELSLFEPQDSDAPLRPNEAFDTVLFPSLLELDTTLGVKLRLQAQELHKEAWFDAPENWLALLGGDEPEMVSPGPVVHVRWEKQQKRMLKRVLRAITDTLPIDALYGADQLPHLLRGQNAPGLGMALLTWLRQHLKRRDIERRLAEMNDIDRPEELAERVDEIGRQANRLSEGEKRVLVVRFLRDYFVLRRDTRLFWTLYQGIERIHLLLKPEAQALSRANGLLQDFTQESEPNRSSQPAGHVIIKADVRGSTRITQQMRERNQNPAAYFSRNFYDPINSLINLYGAGKVFVEGDAVILSLSTDLDGGPDSRFGVARACGLARKILEVMEHKNRQSRQKDLPALELGLGIAFNAESPTYLYDGEHRITISPAINRADRLSSCAKPLRALKPLAKRGDRGVLVAVPAQAGVQGVDEEGFLHYNVNGVEIESAAFFRLSDEVALTEIPGDPKLDEPGVRYFSGSFPDTKKDLHWFVIREAPVSVFLGKDLVPEAAGGRVFYEVVLDRATRDRVRSKMTAD